jgi:hypothetical protein
VVTIAIGAVQASRYVDGKAEAAASVGLVAANLRHGRADPNACSAGPNNTRISLLYRGFRQSCLII